MRHSRCSRQLRHSASAWSQYTAPHLEQKMMALSKTLPMIENSLQLQAVPSERASVEMTVWRETQGKDGRKPISLFLSLTLSYSLFLLSLFLSLTLSYSLLLSLTHSLTHSLSLIQQGKRQGDLCHALRRSAGACFQVQLAPSPEQVRIDRLRLWIAQRGRHHSRIPSLKHDTEPTAPSRKTGRCDVGCLVEGNPPASGPSVLPIVPAR